MDSQQPTEPDYRFTLANERTFLAWIRTALGLLAGSVAVVQLGPDLAPGFRHACGLVLALLATATTAGGLRRWSRTQRAMTHGAQLTRGWLPFVLAGGLVVIGAVVAIATAVAIAGARK